MNLYDVDQGCWERSNELVHLTTIIVQRKWCAMLKMVGTVTLILIMLSGFISVGVCSPEPDVAPLPAKLKIVPPGSEVNGALAKLSGKWVGRLAVAGGGYSADVEHVLVVESIAAGRVTVIYSRAGFNTRTHYSKGWWGRFKAFWDEEKKALLVNYSYNSTYATLTYVLNPDGVLNGSGTLNNEKRTMRLQKELK